MVKNLGQHNTVYVLNLFFKKKFLSLSLSLSLILSHTLVGGVVLHAEGESNHRKKKSRDNEPSACQMVQATL